MNVNVYASESVRENPIWTFNVDRIFNSINDLLKTNRVPLKLFLNKCAWWELPQLDNKVIKQVQNTRGIPPAEFEKDPNIHHKLFLCWLLGEKPRTTDEDIRLGYVGGLYKGIGGLCTSSDNFIVMVATYENPEKDRIAFAHEIFHKLSLPHNENKESLMNASPAHFKLDANDKEKLIQWIAQARAKIITPS